MNPVRPDTTHGPPTRGVDGKPAGLSAFEDSPLGTVPGPEMELTALRETAQASTSTPHLPAVLAAIADQALTLIGAQRCAVFQLDPLDERLKARVARGMPASHAFWPIRLGQGAAGSAALRRQVIFSPDVESRPLPMYDEPWPEAGATLREVVRQQGYRAILSVPLTSRETVLGAVCLYWDQPHAYDEREVRLLTSLAQHAAIAIENARLHADIAEQRREAELLSEITRDLASSLDLALVLRKIIEYAKECCGSDMAFVAPYDRAQQVATIVASVGTRTDVYIGVGIRPGKGVGGQVLETKQAFITRDYLNDPRLSHDYHPLAEQEGFVGNLAVPLLRDGEILGVLWVVNRSARPFTARHQAVLTKLADHAAIAIDHARLYREASDQAQRMRVVAELGRVLVSTLEESRVMELVVTQAHETLGLLDIGIWLEDAESGLFRLVAGHGQFSGPLIQRAEPMDPDEGVVGRALAERRPVWTSDVLHDSRIRLRPASRRWIEEIGGRAILAVPLIREHVLGALVGYRPKGARFADHEVEYLAVFANQVAAALENARLYAESQRARVDLQGKNAELDTFVYSVSHDLKAPLVTIQGMAGLLLEEYRSQLPEEAARYLGRIQANAQQMEQLILDLLALSRIGREARAATAVSLAEVVDDVVADLAGPIRARAVQLVRGELPTIWGIRTQVEQVMGNLVGNALKYLGDTSQGRVEVGAVNRGAFVECSVRDNGIGIDPAYHERIFEVFQRLKDVEVEGTGVGLAIVKRIVQASGGRIWVESAKGQGATFHFTWPKGPASEPQR
jgi:signal transduction histidine kinase